MRSRHIEKVLAVVVRRLVRKYHPEKIILFGSYAEGGARSDSDLDILIVKNTRKRARDRRIEVKKILDTPVEFPPVDAIVMTSGEVRQRLELMDGFVRTIIARGRVIYAKANA